MSAERRRALLHRKVEQRIRRNLAEHEEKHLRELESRELRARARRSR